MHLHELAGREVVVDHGLGLAMVGLEPALDHLGRVVGAPLELGAAQEALAAHGLVELEEEHDRERLLDLVEHRVERLGLREVAREAVEHEAVLGGRQLVPHERDREVVRDEAAVGEERLDLLAERRPRGDRGAEELARRDVREAVLLGDSPRLRPLPRSLRAQNQHVHDGTASEGSLRSGASSSATPSGASCRARRRRRSARRCRRARGPSPARSRST